METNHLSETRHLSEDAIALVSMLPRDLSEEWIQKAYVVFGRTKAELAAPDLLEALVELRKETYRLIEYCIDQRFIDWEDESLEGVKDMDNKLEKANNAIKKATE